MNVLGFVRRSKNIRDVVQTLREHHITVTGPYRTPKGIVIYTLADCVVTERELLDLAKSEKLDATCVSRIGARIMKNGAA